MDLVKLSDEDVAPLASLEKTTTEDGGVTSPASRHPIEVRGGILVAKGPAFQYQREALLYQSPYALTALAQSRVAIEVIVAGLATRAFQASQQASTMAV